MARKPQSEYYTKKDDEPYTTLSIRVSTKKELASICLKEQRYDDLIKDLIAERKRVLTRKAKKKASLLVKEAKP